MAAESSDAPVEIERKFLLTGVPTLPRAADIWQIEQGYLPEPRSVDQRTGAMTGGRLRRITHRDGSVTCFRTVKDGVGVVRTEIEREISRDEFDQLWPRTAGRRLTKTRYRIPEGDRVWEIDVFEGIDLVFAEVELRAADEHVVIPAWLRAFVARDVTDDPAYTNAAIAMRFTQSNEGLTG